MTAGQRFGLMIFIVGVIAYWTIPGIYFPTIIPIVIGGVLFAQDKF